MQKLDMFFCIFVGKKVFLQKAIHDFMDIDLFDQSLCEAVINNTNRHRGKHLC